MTGAGDGGRSRETDGQAVDAIAMAPGRINLIGEHTDYNDGLVLPMAIGRNVCVAIRRTDHERGTMQFRIGGGGDFALTRDQQQRSERYLEAIARAVAGIEPPLPFDVSVVSDVPVGAGLASSAALGCAAALAFDAVSEAQRSRLELARVVQQAEHAALGTPCGLMDPFVSLHAKQGHALLLDCRSLAFDHVPLPPLDTAALLVVNTGVKHDLSMSAYAQRRATCGEVASIIGASSLRDATLSMLQTDTISEQQRARASHVITENTRVLLCASAFAQGDLRTVGDLMFASHESLRSMYEVSCDELDVIVEQAHALRSHAGSVYGARMTGGGFGGCAIVLARAADVDDVRRAISASFANAFGREPSIEVVVASSAARVLSTETDADQESSSTS